MRTLGLYLHRAYGLVAETGMNEMITQVKTDCKVPREDQASGLKVCDRRSCGVREGFPEEVTFKLSFWGSGA